MDKKTENERPAQRIQNDGLGPSQSSSSGAFYFNSSIEALKTKLAFKARVKREGARSSVAARKLVPGDLIHLRLGDIVPACLDGINHGIDRDKIVMQLKGKR